MNNLKVKLPFEFGTLDKDDTRTATMHFMRVFRVMVRNGERPPDDYLECVAELLGAAADAAEEPVSKKRATAIMKAMNLAGRVDTGVRDFHIARAMIYLIELKGMSHFDAKIHMSIELEGYDVVVPEDTLISIFKRYPREELVRDFYSVLTSLIHLDKDPAEYFCNYEIIAGYFQVQ